MGEEVRAAVEGVKVVVAAAEDMEDAVWVGFTR